MDFSKTAGLTSGRKEGKVRYDMRRRLDDRKSYAELLRSFCQDGQQAVRRSQLAKHGGCGYRVGRSDDCAECNGRAPRHRGYERVGHDGDSAGRKSDGEHDEAGDRRPVVPEVSERCVVGGIEQHGSDEERQRKLGRDRERGCARKEREQRTAERQKYRIRCPDAARRGGQDHGCDEEHKKLF